MQATGPLHSQEQRRLLILNQRARDAVAVAAAAAGMGGSVRPVHRLRAAYRDAGAAALLPGHRGRTPAHTRAPCQLAPVNVPPGFGNSVPGAFGNRGLSGVFGETGDERPAHQTLWCYTAWSTRSRSRSKFALPYIMRFKSFRRVT